MSKDTGLRPEEVILQETIKRLDDYKVAASEVIKINNKLETAILNLGNTSVDSDKKIARQQLKIERIKKRRKNLLAALNKEAKKNNDIVKHQIKNNINLKKTINDINSKKSEYIALTKRQISVNNRQKKSIKESTLAMFAKGYAIVQVTKRIYSAVTANIELIKKLESLEFTLSKIVDTYDKVLRVNTFVNNLAEDYGQNILILKNRYIKFLAAAQNSNVSMIDTEKIYRSLIKATAVLGLSQEDLQGVLLAVEQMMSKGKISTEELRRQLGERLPGAMGIMATAAGVSVAKLDKMLKKGEVLSNEILPKFAEAMEKAYNIENVNRVDTLVTAEERLSTAWVKFVDNVVNKSPVLIHMFKALTATVQFFSKTLGGIDLKALKGELRTDAYESTRKQIEITVNAALRAQEQMSNIEITPKLINEEKAYQASLWLDNVLQQIIDYKTELDKAIKESDKANNALENKSIFTSPAQVTELVANKEKAAKKVKEIWEDLQKAYGRKRALEEILNDTTNKVNNDTGNLDKIIKKAKKARKITESTLKAIRNYNAIRLLLLNFEKDELKDFIKDPSSKYEEKIGALNKIYNLTIKINELEYENNKTKLTDKLNSDLASIDAKIKKINEIISENKSNGLETGGAKQELDKLYKYKEKLEAKFNYDKTKLDIEYSIKNNKAEVDRVNKKIELHKAYLNSIHNLESNDIQNAKNDFLIKLNEKYKAGLISYEDYEKEKEAIRIKFEKRILNENIFFFKDMLAEAKRAGDQDSVSKWQSKILEAKRLLSELGIDGLNNADDKLNNFVIKYKDAFLDMMNSINSYIDSIYDANIKMLEDRLQQIEDFYSKQKDLAADDWEQRRLIIREEEIERKKINEKIKAEKRKKAKADKAFAIFETIINTSAAIMKIIADLGAKGIPLSVMVGITGAAKVAAIAAAPIPKYKFGTKYHKGGPAIVGDGYVKEYIEYNKAIYETPPHPTYMQIPKGAKVYKDKNELLKASYSKAIRKNKNNNINIINKNEEIKEAIENGFASSSVDIKVINKVDVFEFYKLKMLE